jgi:tetratricopeptide (TPR) repeat protein
MEGARRTKRGRTTLFTVRTLCAVAIGWGCGAEALLLLRPFPAPPLRALLVGQSGARNEAGETLRTIATSMSLSTRRSEQDRVRLGSADDRAGRVTVPLGANNARPRRERERERVPFAQGPSNVPNYSEADLDLMYRNAITADKQGDKARSVKLLQNLAIVNPRDGRVWRRLARMKKEEGDIAGARNILQSALRRLPRNGHLWHGLGDLASRMGNHEEARAMFRKAISVDPSVGQAFDAWGRMEARLGDLNEAKRVLEQGLLHNPGNNRIWHAYGIVLDNMGESAAAMASFEEGLNLDPMNPFLMVALAISNFRAGNTQAALDIMHECVEHDRRITDAHLTLALIYEMEGRYYKARKVYKYATSEVTGARGRSPQLWMSWARMETVLGRYDDARYVYRNGSRWFPRDAEMWAQWGTWEHYSGDSKTGREALQNAIRIAPNQGRYYMRAAEVEMDLRQYEKARVLLFKGSIVSEGGDDMMPLLVNWAICEWSLGHKERSRSIMEWAARLWDGDKSGTYVWTLWAQLEASDGNLALAAHYSRRALQVNSTDADSWNLLADITNAQGQVSQAAQYRAAAAQARTMAGSGDSGDSSALPPPASPGDLRVPSLHPMKRQATPMMDLLTRFKI